LPSFWRQFGSNVELETVTTDNEQFLGKKCRDATFVRSPQSTYAAPKILRRQKIDVTMIRYIDKPMKVRFAPWSGPTAA
jgi:hypothetical protein